MAPTSDERREVAARLRDAAERNLYSSDDIGESIAAEVNCYGCQREKVFFHLADLIDPTCEAAHDNPFASDFNYRCMACGEHFSTCGEPRYCPGCGRRIEHVK